MLRAMARAGKPPAQLGAPDTLPGNLLSVLGYLPLGLGLQALLRALEPPPWAPPASGLAGRPAADAEVLWQSWPELWLEHPAGPVRVHPPLVITMPAGVLVLEACWQEPLEQLRPRLQQASELAAQLTVGARRARPGSVALVSAHISRPAELELPWCSWARLHQALLDLAETDDGVPAPARRLVAELGELLLRWGLGGPPHLRGLDDLQRAQRAGDAPAAGAAVGPAARLLRWSVEPTWSGWGVLPEAPRSTLLPWYPTRTRRSLR